MKRLILLCMMLALGGVVGGQQKQKAQSNCGVPINGFVGCGEYLKPLPFDVPAKEWDTVHQECCPPGFKGVCEIYPEGGCPNWAKGPVSEHHVSCKDAAPDWRQRVLLETADGKQHCYNFNLLEKP